MVRSISWLAISISVCISNVRGQGAHFSKATMSINFQLLLPLLVILESMNLERNKKKLLIKINLRNFIKISWFDFTFFLYLYILVNFLELTLLKGNIKRALLNEKGDVSLSPIRFSLFMVCAHNFSSDLYVKNPHQHTWIQHRLKCIKNGYTLELQIIRNIYAEKNVFQSPYC